MPVSGGFFLAAVFISLSLVQDTGAIWIGHARTSWQHWLCWASEQISLLFRSCSYLLLVHVYIWVVLRGPRSEENNCTADIYEEVVMTANASSSSTATNSAIVQQRTEQFLKEVYEETWIFSLTRKCLGGLERGKEGRLGFLRLHQYFKELFNTTSHVCLAHPLAILRKQLLPLLFLKWLMLQVNVLAVSIPPYEGVSGQALVQNYSIFCRMKNFLIYRDMTLDRTPGKSDIFRGKHCNRFSSTQFGHPKSTEVLI